MVLGQQLVDCQGQPDVQQAAAGHHCQGVEERGGEVDQAAYLQFRTGIVSQ